MAKGRANKEAAQAEFERLAAEVKRLGNGSHWSLTVAALVEMFVVFVGENRKQRTCAIDKSGLQRLVDAYGGLKAHALAAHHVGSWSTSLKKAGRNETTVALAIEPVLACWNWAVRKGILPNHQLRNIEKPKKRQRDRYLTVAEFQALLRATSTKRLIGFQAPWQQRPSRSAVFRQFLIASERRAIGAARTQHGAEAAGDGWLAGF